MKLYNFTAISKHHHQVMRKIGVLDPFFYQNSLNSSSGKCIPQSLQLEQIIVWNALFHGQEECQSGDTCIIFYLQYSYDGQSNIYF
jgi:hypothetical protein